MQKGLLNLWHYIYMCSSVNLPHYKPCQLKFATPISWKRCTTICDFLWLCGGSKLSSWMVINDELNWTMHLGPESWQYQNARLCRFAPQLRWWGPWTHELCWIVCLNCCAIHLKLYVHHWFIMTVRTPKHSAIKHHSFVSCATPPMSCELMALYMCVL